MKEKTRLRVIQILCIVSLIITVFSIQITYAKYFEKVDTTYATNIKRWVINVNTKNIHEQDTLNQVMTPVFRENAHMNNNNTLVPGREGYFEFLIDYSKVDLAFRFDFDIKQLNTTTITEGEGENITETEIDNFLEDFEIYGYSIVEADATSGEKIETITELETVNDLSGLTQVIDPTTDTDEDKTKQIRILFRWNDDNKDTEDSNDVAGMNNYEDTQYTGNAIEGDSVHTYFNYKVKVTFTQHV